METSPLEQTKARHHRSIFKLEVARLLWSLGSGACIGAFIGMGRPYHAIIAAITYFSGIFQFNLMSDLLKEGAQCLEEMIEVVKESQSISGKQQTLIKEQQDIIRQLRGYIEGVEEILPIFKEKNDGNPPL
jgi:uncharacterized membrane protein YhiD involved in acid resistance